MSEPIELRARRLNRLAVVAGVALTAPAWISGFFSDDYALLAAVEGWSPVSRGFGLYTFVPTDATRVAALVGEGMLPWWSARGLALSLFRPLTSALFRLDHALWGRWALPYHLHTALWFAALLVLAAIVLRRALPAGLAALATAVFCLDDSHAMAAGWISARHATVAVVPVLAGLIAHQRWRDEGWRPGAVLAPLFCAMGLAGGEPALGAMAYLWADELWRERRRRWQAVAPSVLLTIGYLVLHHLGGYGARASGAYLDPFGDSRSFAVAVPQRILLLVGGLLVGTPVDLVLFVARAEPWLVGIGGLSLLVVGLWLPGALERATRAEACATKRLGAGALLAIVASTPGVAGERLLLPASLGGAAVLALLMRDGWRARRLSLPWVGARVVALTALVASGIGLPLKCGFLVNLSARARAAARTAEVDAPVPARVVVLQLDDLQALLLPMIRAVEMGRPGAELAALVEGRAHGVLPAGPDTVGARGWTVLSPATSLHRVRRTAVDSIELWTPDGTMFDTALAGVFRTRRQPLEPGMIVRSGDLSVTVREVRMGRPTRLAVRFDRPLEDPGLVLLEWRAGGLRRLHLAVGEERAIGPDP